MMDPAIERRSPMGMHAGAPEHASYSRNVAWETTMAGRGYAQGIQVGSHSIHQHQDGHPTAAEGDRAYPVAAQVMTYTPQKVHIPGNQVHYPSPGVIRHNIGGVGRLSVTPPRVTHSWHRSLLGGLSRDQAGGQGRDQGEKLGRGPADHHLGGQRNWSAGVEVESHGVAHGGVQAGSQSPVALMFGFAQRGPPAPQQGNAPGAHAQGRAGGEPQWGNRPLSTHRPPPTTYLQRSESESSALGPDVDLKLRSTHRWLAQAGDALGWQRLGGDVGGFGRDASGAPRAPGPVGSITMNSATAQAPRDWQELRGSLVGARTASMNSHSTTGYHHSTSGYHHNTHGNDENNNSNTMSHGSVIHSNVPPFAAAVHRSHTVDAPSLVASATVPSLGDAHSHAILDSDSSFGVGTPRAQARYAGGRRRVPLGPHAFQRLQEAGPRALQPKPIPWRTLGMPMEDIGEQNAEGEREEDWRRKWARAPAGGGGGTGLLFFSPPDSPALSATAQGPDHGHAKMMAPVGGSTQGFPSRDAVSLGHAHPGQTQAQTNPARAASPMGPQELNQEGGGYHAQGHGKAETEAETETETETATEIEMENESRTQPGTEVPAGAPGARLWGEGLHSGGPVSARRRRPGAVGWPAGIVHVQLGSSVASSEVDAAHAEGPLEQEREGNGDRATHKGENGGERARERELARWGRRRLQKAESEIGEETEDKTETGCEDKENTATGPQVSSGTGAYGAGGGGSAAYSAGAFGPSAAYQSAGTGGRGEVLGDVGSPNPRVPILRSKTGPSQGSWKPSGLQRSVTDFHAEPGMPRTHSTVGPVWKGSTGGPALRRTGSRRRLMQRPRMSPSVVLHSEREALRLKRLGLKPQRIQHSASLFDLVESASLGARHLSPFSRRPIPPSMSHPWGIAPGSEMERASPGDAQDHSVLLPTCLTADAKIPSLISSPIAWRSRQPPRSSSTETALAPVPVNAPLSGNATGAVSGAVTGAVAGVTGETGAMAGALVVARPGAAQHRKKTRFDVSASEGESDAAMGMAHCATLMRHSNLAKGGLGLLLWQHQRRSRSRRPTLGRPKQSPSARPSTSTGTGTREGEQEKGRAPMSRSERELERWRGSLGPVLEEKGDLDQTSPHTGGESDTGAGCSPLRLRSVATLGAPRNASRRSDEPESSSKGGDSFGRVSIQRRVTTDGTAAGAGQRACARAAQEGLVTLQEAEGGPGTGEHYTSDDAWFPEASSVTASEVDLPGGRREGARKLHSARLREEESEDSSEEEGSEDETEVEEREVGAGAQEIVAEPLRRRGMFDEAASVDEGVKAEGTSVDEAGAETSDDEDVEGAEEGAERGGEAGEEGRGRKGKQMPLRAGLPQEEGKRGDSDEDSEEESEEETEEESDEGTEVDGVECGRLGGGTGRERVGMEEDDVGAEEQGTLEDWASALDHAAEEGSSEGRRSHYASPALTTFGSIPVSPAMMSASAFPLTSPSPHGTPLSHLPNPSSVSPSPAILSTSAYPYYPSKAQFPSATPAEAYPSAVVGRGKGSKEGTTVKAGVSPAASSAPTQDLSFKPRGDGRSAPSGGGGPLGLGGARLRRRSRAKDVESAMQVMGLLTFWMGFCLAGYVGLEERKRLKKELKRERQSAAFLARMTAMEWARKQEAERQKVLGVADGVLHGGADKNKTPAGEGDMGEVQSDDAWGGVGFGRGSDSGERGGEERLKRVEKELQAMRNERNTLRAELGETRAELEDVLAELEACRASLEGMDMLRRKVDSLRVCLEVSRKGHEQSEEAATALRSKLQRAEAIARHSLKERKKLKQQVVSTRNVLGAIMLHLTMGIPGSPLSMLPLMPHTAIAQGSTATVPPVKE